MENIFIRVQDFSLIAPRERSFSDSFFQSRLERISILNSSRAVDLSTFGRSGASGFAIKKQENLSFSSKRRFRSPEKSSSVMQPPTALIGKNFRALIDRSD